MSSYKKELSDSILSYLQSEFPNFSIEEQREAESYCFRLNCGAEQHFLRVMYTAIESSDAADIALQLEQFSVAATMRGLGDFPVVVTEYGCIFGSP